MDCEALRRYERYWRANRSIEQRLAAMKAAEVNISPRPGDGSQRTGPHDPLCAVDRRMDFGAAHRAEYLANAAVMQAVDEAICAMDDPLEREVLRLRYTDLRYGQQMTWPQVRQALYGGCKVSERTVYALHDRALRHYAAKEPARGA